MERAVVVLALSLAASGCGRIGFDEVGEDPPDDLSWEQLKGETGSGVSETTDSSYEVTLTLLPNDAPFVAWIEAAGTGSEIYGRAYDGTRWRELSGSATGSGISALMGRSEWPAVATGAGGEPLVAWYHWTGDQAEVLVRSHGTGGWNEVIDGSGAVTGISDNPGSSRLPDIASAGGITAVAWQDTSTGPFQVYVRMFRDGADITPDGAAMGGGVSDTLANSRRPAIAVDYAGRITVAWNEGDGDAARIFVARSDGGAFAEVSAGSASGDGISGGPAIEPAVAVAPDGNLYVAWLASAAGGNHVYVRRLRGTVWEEVGEGSAQGTGVSGELGPGRRLAVATTSTGLPWIAWSVGRSVYAKRFDGLKWKSVAGSALDGLSTMVGDVGRVEMVIDSRDRPVIAWSQDDDVFVRRLSEAP